MAKKYDRTVDINSRPPGVLADIQSNILQLLPSSSSENYKDLIHHLLRLTTPHHPTPIGRTTLHQLVTEGSNFSETLLEWLEVKDIHRITSRDRVRLKVHVWSTRGGLVELREKCGVGSAGTAGGHSPSLDQILSSFVKYKLYLSFLLMYSCE